MSDFTSRDPIELIKLNGTYRKLFDLKGKVAVVTGGAGILGRHFCAGLADAGANVAVIDIDTHAAHSLAQELASSYDVTAKGYSCDVSDDHSVKQIASQILTDFNRIDILHNNAATKTSDLNAFFASFEEYELSEWRKVMSVNLDGMFLMAQAVGKIMLMQGTGGSIIQTASIYGVQGPDQRIYEGSQYMGQQINTPAVYSVSKAGVIGLTKYLATYWAHRGIRVNTLTPGGVESGQNEIFLSNYSARVPLQRMSKPEEMVGALLYLASDASSYVTGQNIIIDGGLSCW
jgi:NAD(P)-dependent dehydrogenase (short-subunit alcohol dehydrogenase family)